METQPGKWREIRVTVQQARDKWYVAVVARSVRAHGRERSESLLWRGVLLGLPPSATSAECLRLAAAALNQAADRL
jgi:hypothetical protein